MPTKNIVPRANLEGQLGTEKKKWIKVYADEISATKFKGNLQGNADTATNATNATNATKATQDSTGQQINTTYVKNSEIANTANKIPRYNQEGHLVLPNGIEIW